MSDIFKDMQEKVGCEYISDLPSYKRKVWQEMKRLNPADYEERQLEDFSNYVFGMSYQTLKDGIYVFDYCVCITCPAILDANANYKIKVSNTLYFRSTT